MKSYVTSGTGSQQTLTGSQDEKVAIYQTLADAEADLANLEAGQIVATPDTGDENAQPVDSVTDGDMHAVTSNAVFDTYAVITASSTTLTGKPPISQDSVIKIMFTSAISGSNTTTGMSISYNGTSYPVKVGKNGSLANFVASEISSGVYRYLQAYTTLELIFDGTQFIIIGNPVVLSSADYTIYADGKKIINSIEINNMNAITSNAVYNGLLAKLDDDIIHSNIYSTAFKILASCYANNVSTWGAHIFNENGRHMYLVAAQRITTNKTFLSIVSTDGNKNDKTILDSIIVNTESQFSVVTNNQGTYELKYADPSNMYNYNIFVMKLA